MAFFVLIGLIAILIVYISLAKKKKRALLISVVILGMFNLYVRHTCGPNSADVKVMKPMAEKISEYIVKNGIPESLKDIPDLPYALEECERDKHYYGDINDTTMQYIELSSRIGATSTTTRENCKFVENGRKYYLNSRALFELNKNTGGVSIDIGNKKSETWDIMHFDIDKNNNILSDNEINFGSSKSSGICKSWRQ